MVFKGFGKMIDIVVVDLAGNLPDTPHAVSQKRSRLRHAHAGRGTEDYFCGSYNFENKLTKQYQEFTTPHAGMPFVERPDGTYNATTRFALYRWHILDPVRFQRDIKVTLQALGWCHDGFHQRMDDLSSVAFWYQQLPTAPFPDLPDRTQLEII